MLYSWDCEDGLMRESVYIYSSFSSRSVFFVFSMAYGVEHAAVICCFMTSDYFVSYLEFMLLRFILSLSTAINYFCRLSGRVIIYSFISSCQCNPNSF